MEIHTSSFRTLDDTLHVGNLAFTTTEEGLRKFFEAAGRKVALAKVITNYKSGRSRGFAFVRMASVDDAEAGLELDGSELDGRQITVGKGREKSLRRPRSRK